MVVPSLSISAHPLGRPPIQIPTQQLGIVPASWMNRMNPKGVAPPASPQRDERGRWRQLPLICPNHRFNTVAQQQRSAKGGRQPCFGGKIPEEVTDSLGVPPVPLPPLHPGNGGAQERWEARCARVAQLLQKITSINNNNNNNNFNLSVPSTLGCYGLGKGNPGALVPQWWL